VAYAPDDGPWWAALLVAASLVGLSTISARFAHRPACERHDRRPLKSGHRHTRSGKHRSFVLAVCAFTASVFGTSVASASAESLSVSVTPNPAIFASTMNATVAISGVAAPTKNPYGTVPLQATEKPAGGAASCPASPSADAATANPIYNSSVPQAADGSFSAQGTWSLGDLTSAGTYLICAWASHGDGTYLAPASTVLTLREPHASVTLSQPVADPGGFSFRLTVNYALETSAGYLTVAVIAGSPACPADPGYPANGNFGVIVYRHVGGADPLSGTSNVTEKSPYGNHLQPGPWRVCGYVTGQVVGEAVLASATSLVNVPKGSSGTKSHGGGCTVPSLKGKRLALAKRTLSAKHCATGAVRRTHKKGSKRGTVISQSARPGTRLRAGSKVSLVVAK
jgi:hypothetical protein